MAGLLLARAGIDVLVLEKHADFLRDFRGDTVHPSTLDVLAELGWLDDFLRLPHQELTHIRACIEGQVITLADFRHVPSRLKLIALMPQWDFLSFLVTRAQQFPRFALRMQTEAVDLLRSDGRICGVRARTPAGELEVSADLVIAADGRNSVLRDRAGLRVRDVGAPMDVLWFRLPRRDDDPGQSLGWVKRGRFVVLLDRGDYWQVGFLIRKGGFESIRAAGIEAFRRDLAATVPFLANRTDGIRNVDDLNLLVVRVDRLERWWLPGLLCIGDAAHAMSPIGGVGINLAIQDAVAAASLLADPLRRGPPSESELARVQRRRSPPARATQAIQVAIQKRVIDRVLAGDRPVRVGRAFKLIDRIPVLQRVPAYVIGVGVRPEHVARM
jgi:2-polyprenyl-6-methoxyphenol hydroxylase-like FAD-dependent oxidoreductase